MSQAMKDVFGKFFAEEFATLVDQGVSEDSAATACAILRLARALESVGVSPNEADSNGENANIVDGLFALKRSLVVKK